MHFRAATQADIPSLRDLAHRIWRACYPAIISVEQIEFMLGWMYSAEQIEKELREGVSWEVIENAQGEPVGFLSFQMEADSRVKLNKLYVLPELHGQGIGMAALGHVVDAARGTGARSVWMQVNKGNQRAVAAYQKAGFRIAKEVVFDIGNGFVMNDFLMEKELETSGQAPK